MSLFESWDRHGFVPRIEIWFFKLTSLPREGEPVSKDNYKGFTWCYEPRSVIMRRFVINLPVKIDLRNRLK